MLALRQSARLLAATLLAGFIVAGGAGATEERREKRTGAWGRTHWTLVLPIVLRP